MKAHAKSWRACAALSILAAACSAHSGGAADVDASPAMDDAGPTAVDARPADAHAGPDARPQSDAALPDAGAPAADAQPLCTGTACNACTTFDNPVVGMAAWPTDDSLFINSLVTEGAHVYVSTGATGIRIYDVDSAGTLTLDGSLVTGGSAIGLAVRGDYLYVADGDNGLVVVDVTDPTNPMLYGHVAFTGATAVALGGNFAYVADNTLAIRVVEITDPMNPVLAGGGQEAAQAASSVAVAGDRAYIGDSNGIVMVYDITNPYMIHLLGELNLDIDGLEGVAAGPANPNIFYIADGNNGVLVYDATNGASPQAIGAFIPEPWGAATQLDLEGNTMYVAHGTRGVDILDVTTPANPVLLGTYREPGGAEQIAIADGLIITGNFTYGVEALDPTRVLAVTQITSESTVPDDFGRHMVTDGSFIYIAGGSHGLEVVDLSSGTPVLVATAPIAGGVALFIAYADGKVYVSSSEAGLVIFDVSNPRSPSMIGSLAFGGDTGPIAVAGDWVYIYGYGGFLYSVFVANPAKPGLGGTLANIPNTVNGMAVSGNHVYLAITYVGLTAIDVTDPYHPMTAGTLLLNSTDDSANDVVITGNLALVATAQQGLNVVDISTPGAPSLVSTFDTPGTALSVTVDGHFAYVGERVGMYTPPDVQIIDISTPATPTLALALDATDEVDSTLVIGQSILELLDHTGQADELIWRRACGQ